MNKKLKAEIRQFVLDTHERRAALYAKEGMTASVSKATITVSRPALLLQFPKASGREIKALLDGMIAEGLPVAYAKGMSERREPR